MFAVIRIPAFALQAITRVDASLTGRPVALLAEGQRGMVIAECNALAQAAGVEAGHASPRAQARCPDIILRTREPEMENEATAALLAAAFSVTAYVELTAPGICTLGLELLPAARRKRAVQQALDELGHLRFEATAGLGATPLLALYAAQHAQPGQIQSGDHTFLASLPIAAAEPSPELVPILAGWGIHTLGQLTKLTKADVVQRLGRTGLTFWEKAAGETTRPLQVVAPARDFTAGFECEQAMETLEPLLFILRRFVDRLALELRNEHLAALALELLLNLDDGSTHHRVIRLPEPTTDPSLLFRALQTHVETVRTAAPIVGVRLKLEPSRVMVRQQGLFDGGLRDPHGFADTMARVIALVGADRAGRPVPADTHRPDAFKIVSPPSCLTTLPDTSIHPPQGLALRRYRPSQPARVVLAENRPNYIWAAGVGDAVIQANGPWQGSGDWWEAGCFWETAEWDVQMAGGGLYRLSQSAKGWFIEGEYD